MPRLLMLANHFVQHGGGLEIIAHELACHLSGQNEFTVTLSAHGEAPAEAPYETLPLKVSQSFERLTGLPILLPQAGEFRKIARAVEQSDCVIIHDNLYLSHLYAQHIAKKAGIPVLLIKHTGWVQGQSGIGHLAQVFANTLLLQRSMRTANRLVAVTDAKRDNILQHMPGLSIQVVENGIDTDYFSIGAPSRDFDVLFIGRFVPKKGIGLVPKLAKACPELKIACAGFGPLAPDASQHDNLKLILNPDRETIRQAYRRARLTIIPCLSEGTPLTMMESLACGTPVLASTQAAHPALDQVSTLPIDLDWPSDTVDGWADAVRRLLKTAIDPHSLRKRVVEHFSLAVMGQRYDAIIRELLTPKS